MASRQDIRNVGIVAHVDHGKTTLVDALLWQSGAFREGQDVADRVLDSMDLEREKGITILAKNTAVHYGGVKLNIVDTPGHADFGGEVERGLTMVDGVLLLVDASEGPLPQTRFVLRKALEARLPVILVDQQGRSARRPDRRGRRRGLRAVPRPRRRRVADRVPDRLHEREGRPGVARPRRPRGPTSGRCSSCWSSTCPRPSTTPTTRCRRTSPTSTPPRTWAGSRSAASATATIRRGETVAWCRADGDVERVKVTELYVTEALDRVDADEAGPGEIISVAGIPEIMIGETLAAADDPRPLPVITVDEPSLSITIGINTSPLAGQDGDKLTASQVKARLDRELVGNVSLRVLDTERPEVWEVQGRGELALAVLVELMRREGFELTVGNPQVVTREVDGKLCEPIERMSVDVRRTTSAWSRRCSRSARAGWSRWSTTGPGGCGWSTWCPPAG